MPHPSSSAVASLVVTLSLALAPAAHAIEFGYLRGLQHGAIGDSPQFADVSKYEAEAAIGMTRTWGKYTQNGDADSKASGTGFKTRVAAGGGMAPAKNFAMSAYVDVTLASDFDEERTRNPPQSKLDTGNYRHEFAAFGVFKGSPILVGGGLGVLIVGSEERIFVYGDDKYKSNITSAAMPVLRLFGGVTTKEFDGTVGVRFFSKGDSVVKASAPGGANEEYDIVRRNPGEVHADTRLKLGMVDVAGSLAYVLTGQSSESVDEFSVAFNSVGSTRERATGNARRNSDHFRAAAGARVNVAKTIGVLGGLSYVGASYAEEQYASLEHENLGGLRLDIGADATMDNFRGFFQGAYAMESSASFTAKNDRREVANLDQTQRPPLSEGDKVKISQGSWTIVAGGGVVF
jgi:hypothetical protein